MFLKQQKWFIYMYIIFLNWSFWVLWSLLLFNAYNLHKPFADFIELASRKTVETDAFTILCRPILTTSFIWLKLIISSLSLTWNCLNILKSVYPVHFVLSTTWIWIFLLELHWLTYANSFKNMSRPSSPKTSPKASRSG